MPTLNGDTVPWSGGLNVYAEGSPAAWGARLIVDQSGYVDFVADRCGAAGADADVLFGALDTELPICDLRYRIGALLRSGEMQTRVGRHFVLHKSDRLAVHANTNGSGGYCYVIAVLRTPESDQVEADLEAPVGSR